MAAHVVTPPVDYEGVVLRAVLSEGWVYSEAWTGTAWVRAGLLSDVLKGRPLSATDLERLEIPADADPSPRPAPEPPPP